MIREALMIDVPETTEFAVVFPYIEDQKIFSVEGYKPDMTHLRATYDNVRDFINGINELCSKVQKQKTKTGSLWTFAFFLFIGTVAVCAIPFIYSYDQASTTFLTFIMIFLLIYVMLLILFGLVMCRHAWRQEKPMSVAQSQIQKYIEMNKHPWEECGLRWNLEHFPMWIELEIKYSLISKQGAGPKINNYLIGNKDLEELKGKRRQNIGILTHQELTEQIQGKIPTKESYEEKVPINFDPSTEKKLNKAAGESSDDDDDSDHGGQQHVNPQEILKQTPNKGNKASQEFELQPQPVSKNESKNIQQQKKEEEEDDEEDDDDDDGQEAKGNYDDDDDDDDEEEKDYDYDYDDDDDDDDEDEDDEEDNSKMIDKIFQTTSHGSSLQTSHNHGESESYQRENKML